MHDIVSNQLLLLYLSLLGVCKVLKNVMTSSWPRSEVGQFWNLGASNRIDAAC